MARQQPMADLNPNYYGKRDYLLPLGCKDLIDVLNLTKREEAWPEVVTIVVPLPKQVNDEFTVEINPTTTVKDLAEILYLKPATVSMALMELGIFANINQTVDFDHAAKLLAKYGYFATKPA